LLNFGRGISGTAHTSSWSVSSSVPFRPFAAIGLKLFVRQMHRIPGYFFSVTNTHIWYFLLPVAGIIITVFIVRIFFKGHLEKGLGPVLFSIARRSARVGKENIYSHVITSGVTIGLGGSAGLEAPIVITGSAIGSNIASRLGFGYKERSLLLACGAAAGIATVFNSPIAGVIFAIEVLLTDISIPLFIPLLISTATATIISKLLYKGQLFYLITTDWYFHAIPFLCHPRDPLRTDFDLYDPRHTEPGTVL